MEDLSQLKETIASLEAKVNEIKGSMDEDDKYSEIFSFLYDMNVATRRYLYELEEKLARHASPEMGHLPKIQGAGKMSKALEVLGIGEDYEVEKPTIYSRASSNGSKTFDIELKTKKQ